MLKKIQYVLECQKHGNLTINQVAIYPEKYYCLNCYEEDKSYFVKECKKHGPLQLGETYKTGVGGKYKACKICSLKLAADWAKKNKKRVNETKKIYYKKNKLKFIKSSKNSYKKNRDKIVSRQKNYYQKNKEKINAKSKKKYKEMVLAYKEKTERMKNDSND